MDQSGGYDANFVDNVGEYLTCVICQMVLREPVLFVVCGHRFCRSCFDQMKQHSSKRHEDLLCPNDRTKVDVNKVFDDKGISRMILDLKCKCDHHSEGCEWEGELRDLQKHLDSSCSITEKERTGTSALLKRLELCENKLNERDEEYTYMQVQLIQQEEDIAYLKEELKQLKAQNQHSHGRVMPTAPLQSPPLAPSVVEKYTQDYKKLDDHRKYQYTFLDPSVVEKDTQDYKKLDDNRKYQYTPMTVDTPHRVDKKEIEDMIISYEKLDSRDKSRKYNYMKKLIEANYEENFHILLQRKPHEIVKLKSRTGVTLLMEAARGVGKVMFVQSLLNNGSDVNAKDSSGDTAMYYAQLNNCTETIQILLSNGANPVTRHR